MNERVFGYGAALVLCFVVLLSGLAFWATILQVDGGFLYFLIAMGLLAALRLLRRSPVGRGPFGRDPSGARWRGLALAHRWLDRWEARFELLRRWAAALLLVAVLALAGSHAFGPANPMLARAGGSTVKRPLRHGEGAGWQPLAQTVARALALNAGIGVLALGEARYLLYGARQG